MIKYSVIVPVFNSFSSLKAILDWFSLEYSQRDGDIELIVVDDGSTEKPEYIVAQPGVRLFKKDNGGVSSARNFGLNKSTGEYISFLDSDDSYINNFFQKLDCLLDEAIPVLLFSSSIATDSNEKPLRNKDSIASGPSVIRSYYEKEIHAHVCSLVISKAYLMQELIKFDESIGYSEDILFISQVLSNAGNCRVSSELMYRYYKHDGSAIGSPVSSKALTHFNAFKEIQRLPFGEEKEASFFLATCHLNVLRFSLVYGVEDVVTRDVILRKAYHLGKARMIPFSKYGLLYIAFRSAVVVDKLLGNRIFKKIIRLGERSAHEGN